jgi:hypothetical protein
MEAPCVAVRKVTDTVPEYVPPLGVIVGAVTWLCLPLYLDKLAVLNVEVADEDKVVRPFEDGVLLLFDDRVLLEVVDVRLEKIPSDDNWTSDMGDAERPDSELPSSIMIFLLLAKVEFV